MARAEADLTALIARLAASGDPSVTRDAQQQLTALQTLRGQVATARLLDLIALRGDVAANVASASSVVAQGQGVAERAAAAAGLAQADAQVRQSVAGFMDDYFTKRMFDGNLKFTNDADEKAFRERERERQEAIARAQAKGTPQGDLKAGRLALAQADDAGVHGADQNPDFVQMHRGLAEKVGRLAQATEASSQVHASAPSTQDPLDAVVAGKVDATTIAGLKAAGVVQADEAQAGHGIAQAPSAEGAKGR